MKIYDDYAEQVAVEYFSNISNTVGAVGLGIFVSLLHVESPNKSAFLAFVILFLWAFSQGAEYRKMLKVRGVRPNYLVFIRVGWLSYVSLVLLCLLGLGFIQKGWFV